MNRVDPEAVLRLGPLPVSGQKVILRPLTGAEDQLLLEAPDGDIALALALIGRLAQLADDDKASDIAAAADWRHLTATDLDILILRLRQAILGDRIQADVPCEAPACGQRIDISFGIDEYIAHHVPLPGTKQGRGWSIEPAEEPGWFRLLDGRTKTDVIKGFPGPAASSPPPADSDRRQLNEIFFRVPTVADQLMVAGRADATEALARLCTRPPNLLARHRRQIEAAMEAMAPNLSEDLLGTCPECESEVTVFFDARSYCLRELRERAAFIYEDIDILARRYRWAESDILALPRNRRMIYAELARQEGRC